MYCFVSTSLISRARSSVKSTAGYRGYFAGPLVCLSQTIQPRLPSRRTRKRGKWGSSVIFRLSLFSRLPRINVLAVDITAGRIVANGQRIMLLGFCDGNSSPVPTWHIYVRPDPADATTPENRRRSGSLGKPPKRSRIRRGHHRTSPTCRTGFHPALIPDKSRIAIRIGRCHAGCRREWRWCRRERRHNKCASNLGDRRIGGG
jgi:hypothetical protein